MQRSIKEAIKKGNKQIRASKRSLDKLDAKGLLLIANDANHGFDPSVIFQIICYAASQLEDNHIDGFVYFTPNVYHSRPNSQVAWQVWMPSYKNDDQHDLACFVNEMGAAWGDFFSQITGDQAVERLQTADPEIIEKTFDQMTPDRTARG
jgi:hypothetical protein